MGGGGGKSAMRVGGSLMCQNPMIKGDTAKG